MYCARQHSLQDFAARSTWRHKANGNDEERFDIDIDLWPFDLKISAHRGSVTEFSFWSANRQTNKQTQLNAVSHACSGLLYSRRRGQQYYSMAVYSQVLNAHTETERVSIVLYIHLLYHLTISVSWSPKDRISLIASEYWRMLKLFYASRLLLRRAAYISVGRYSNHALVAPRAFRGKINLQN